MNKILIQIDVPATSVSYEVWVYPHMGIHSVLELLKGYVNEQSEGEYQTEDSTLLCDVQGVPLNPNILVCDAKLQNGSRLILI